MELRSFSQFHYIQAVKNGSVVKAQSVYKGRPNVKYKSLADVYKSEDAKTSDPVSELHPKDEFEIKGEISCPPSVELRTKEIDTESDCHIGDCEENECGDSGFSKMTLKEIMGRCKTNKRKRSNNVDVIDETDRYCSPPEFSHTEVEPENDIDDHEITISSWKDKLKSKMKLKKKMKYSRACVSASNAIILKSESHQIDESLQQCVVNNLPTPQSVKIESLETDYSDFRSLVCISENSSSPTDEDADDSCSIHTELPVYFIEESHCYPRTLVPHKMNDDKPDTFSHVGSCGGTVEVDPLKVSSQESGYDSEKYTNNPCMGECGNTVSAEVPNTSGCNVHQSLSSNNEMPGQDNSGIQVQVPKVDVHVSGSHMLSCGDEECLSSHTTCSGISHSAVSDSLPSDSEVCKRSSPTSLSVGHEMHNTSNLMELGKGTSSSLFDGSPKDEETLNFESDMSRNPVMQYSPPSDSALNGTCPTAKDCSASWNLNSPASSESCFVSVKSNSPAIKGPIVSDYAAERSMEIQLHDDFNKSATSAGNASSDNIKLRRPQRLLSTRKFISPVSQKRLRQILECIDQAHDEDYKCREKVCSRKYTPDKIGRAEKPYPNRRFEVTVKPKLREVTSKPKLIMRKLKDCMKDTLPKDSIKIYRHSHQMPDVNSGCSSIKSWLQSAIEFSQWQMQDMDCLAGRLLHELKSMKDVVKETQQSQFQPALRSRYRTDKVRMAIENATRLEESTMRWLSTMSKDCKRFCKIMALTGEGSAITANGAERERKITFADEVGEELCHVKVFEADMASGVQPQPPESGVSG